LHADAKATATVAVLKMGLRELGKPEFGLKDAPQKLLVAAKLAAQRAMELDDDVVHPVSVNVDLAAPEIDVIPEDTEAVRIFVYLLLTEEI
jgi:hypothetical protein